MSEHSEEKMKFAIRIDPRDNVATVTDTVNEMEMVHILSEDGKEIDKVQVKTDVPLPFHKIALVHIDKEEEVKKYGEIIGYATKLIARGEWVHVHNLESANLSVRETKQEVK